MGILHDDKKPKKDPAPATSVGDIVLLYAENAAPVPAVVLGVNEDGSLDVNDLSGSYGRQYALLPKDEQADTQVLSWVARGGQ